MEGRKEGNVLFNDALNTFYLRLYGVGHILKYHLDSERKHAATTWATLSDYMHHPTDRIANITAFVTPVVEHWLKQEIAQWVQRWNLRIFPMLHRGTSRRKFVTYPVFFVFK